MTTTTTGVLLRTLDLLALAPLSNLLLVKPLPHLLLLAQPLPPLLLLAQPLPHLLLLLTQPLPHLLLTLPLPLMRARFVVFS
jgi:hypothetical protein